MTKTLASGIAIVSLVGLLAMLFVMGMFPRGELVEVRRAVERCEFDEALAILERSLERRPESADLYLLRARIHRKQGQLHLVRDDLKKALAAGADRRKVQREEWMALAQVGQFKEAEQHLAQLLMDPGEDGPDICEAYVNGYFVSYRFNEAFQLLDAWQKDFPKDAQPYFFRAAYFIQGSTWKLALENLQTALELAPNRYDVRLELAKTLMKLQQSTEATPHIEWLLQRVPEDVRVQSVWAELLTEQGKVSEARKVLQGILDRDPSALGAIMQLGMIELKENNSEAALSLFEKLLPHRRQDTELRYALARTLEKLGRPDDAKVHYQFVTAAQSASRQRRQLIEAIKTDPRDVHARFQMAEMLKDFGTPTERLMCLRSVLEIDPKHQAAHQALADCYEELGEAQEAIKHRHLAEALGTKSNP